MRPMFVKDPTMQQDGMKVRMEVRVKADPRARATWYFNTPSEKDIVKDTERYRMKSEDQKDGTTIFTLVITSPKQEDAGTYLMKAFNNLGENMAKFNLNLGVPPEDDGIIPEFAAQPTISSTEDNKELTIECLVKASPKPTASWIFDDKTLFDKDRHRLSVTYSGNNKWACRLKIQNPAKEDGGRYKCTAKNKWGSCFGSVTLQF